MSSLIPIDEEKGITRVHVASTRRAGRDLSALAVSGYQKTVKITLTTSARKAWRTFEARVSRPAYWACKVNKENIFIILGHTHNEIHQDSMPKLGEPVHQPCWFGLLCFFCCFFFLPGVYSYLVVLLFPCRPSGQEIQGGQIHWYQVFLWHLAGLGTETFSVTVDLLKNKLLLTSRRYLILLYKILNLGGLVALVDQHSLGIQDFPGDQVGQEVLVPISLYEMPVHL